MTKPSLSIVVPVYNSEATLEELAKEISLILNCWPAPVEAIFVNDGSRDNSWHKITSLFARYPWLRGIDLGKNYGQHNALLAGIRAAKHDVIVTLDDDLQNPPKELTKLVARLDEGFDVVYGCPLQGSHSFLRNLSSRVTKLALKVAVGADVAPHVSAFRAFRTSLRDAFALHESEFICIDVLLSWATSRFSALKIEHNERKHGKSNYTFSKLLTHALNMFTGYSTTPLRIASSLGLLLTAFGGFCLVFVLTRYFVNGAFVPGFAFTACLISILSGAQLFALGIAGEYLARTYSRTMQRPSYLVREERGASMEKVNYREASKTQTLAA